MYKLNELVVPLNREACCNRISINTENKLTNARTWDNAKKFEGRANAGKFKFYVNGIFTVFQVGPLMLDGRVESDGDSQSKVFFVTRLTHLSYLFYILMVTILLFNTFLSLINGYLSWVSFVPALVAMLIVWVLYSGYKSLEQQSLKVFNEVLYETASKHLN